VGGRELRTVDGCSAVKTSICFSPAQSQATEIKLAVWGNDGEQRHYDLIDQLQTRIGGMGESLREKPSGAHPKRLVIVFAFWSDGCATGPVPLETRLA
jgi:hypothetical protein